MGDDRSRTAFAMVIRLGAFCLFVFGVGVFATVAGLRGSTSSVRSGLVLGPVMILCTLYIVVAAIVRKRQGKW